MDLVAYYRLVREHVDQETHLVNGRLSWLVGSETFLFIGYANVQVATGRIRREVVTLRTLLPVVGLLIATVILIAVHASTVVTYRLRRRYERGITRYEDEHGMGTQLPPLVGGKWSYRMSLVPVYGLPLVFIGTWAYLITLH